jgi:hypothetical protein
VKTLEEIPAGERMFTAPVRCVFCGGRVFRLERYPTDLAHSLPPCASFVRLEPREFLTAMLAKMAADAN